MRSLALLAVTAIFLSGCAIHHPYVCRPEPDPFELSPKNRHSRQYDVSLIAISQSKRVTIRIDTGKLAFAHPGEEFKLRNGSPAEGGYRLRSVDVSSGRVVIEGTEFVMGAQ